MVEYGYIEDGLYLVSKILRDYVESYRDDNDEIKHRTVTVEDQITEYAKNGYKPVDPIDEKKLSECEENYIYRLQPYDAGDHIAYEYVKMFDIQKFKGEINNLKKALSGNDYKITKCMEAKMLDIPLPYDIQAVHVENQAMRDRINEIEDFIKLNIEG